MLSYFGMITDVVRDTFAAVIDVQIAVVLFTNTVSKTCRSVINPVVSEVGRFMTVLRPEPVVWYSKVCVSRGISTAWRYTFPTWRETVDTDALYGSGYHKTLLEFGRYAKFPGYRSQVCVSYITTFDFLLLVLILGALAGGAYMSTRVLLRYDDPAGRVWFSKIVDWFIKQSEQPLINVATFRKEFTTNVGVVPRIPKNHTHPNSAAIRSASSSTIELICRCLGLKPYFVQRSKSDVKIGKVGSRSYYWGKDLGVEASEFNPPKHSVIAIVDTDMYLDMPTIISKWVHTYMISTFQPTSVASDEGEYSFTFDENNEVTYTVSGGAKYVHKVWNYSGDTYIARGYTNCGLSVRTTSYNVDRRQISKHHQIICLTPSKTFTTPIVIPVGWMLGGDSIQRYDVARGQYLRLQSKTEDGTLQSTGEVNSLSSVTIPAVLDCTLATLSLTGKVDLSMAQVKSVIEDITTREASILVSYHRKKVLYSSDVVFPVSESINNYQFGPKSYDPAAAPLMVPFMSPILDECYVPVKTRSNEQAAVQGRILDVRPSADLEITDHLFILMKEFVDKLVPDSMAGKGIPVDYDEVYARQSRPTQVNILNAGSEFAAVTVEDPVKSFLKAECYTDIKDPRIISTIPATNKLNYSCYIYAFVDEILKKQDWYAFSKTPKEISERVAAICELADMIANTDLSRYDGRVALFFRLLEDMMMGKWCHPDHLDRLKELMSSQHSQKAVTTQGVKYESIWARLSGSAETSGFNSITNAFMAYAALRGTRINGAYMTSDEAWKALGLYGGDDGITANVDPEVYVKVCASVGQKLEVIETKRGELGVSFLSRNYSREVFHGSTDSMCDVPRQLAKLHTTPRLAANVTPEMKLREKMTGFYLTDRNTPIIGELALAVIDITDGLETPKYGIANYFSRFPDHEQFPNFNENDWMTHAIVESMPTFDILLFRDWLRNAELDRNLLLEPPLCVPRKVSPLVVKRPVVVHGDIVLPPGGSIYDRCKHIVSGECRFGENCHHITKKQRCYGELCRFKHGKVPSPVPDETPVVLGRHAPSRDSSISFGSLSSGDSGC